jgi:hypothetical protein
MAHAISKPQPSRISHEFATRLDHLAAKKRVRAVVMLRTGNSAIQSTRPARKDRATLVHNARETAAAALSSIDRILKRHHGKRLSADVGPLGNIVVEATADGILALAASEHVTAVLEDQSILQLAPPRT